MAAKQGIAQLFSAVLRRSSPAVTSAPSHGGAAVVVGRIVSQLSTSSVAAHQVPLRVNRLGSRFFHQCSTLMDDDKRGGHSDEDEKKTESATDSKQESDTSSSAGSFMDLLRQEQDHALWRDGGARSVTAKQNLEADVSSRATTGGKFTPTQSPSATTKQSRANDLPIAPVQRRGGVTTVKSPVVPVPAAQPDIAAKFINNIMKHGKKTVAQRIFNDMLEIIKLAELERLRKESSGKGGASNLIEHHRKVDPMQIFLDAMANVQPVVGTSPVKKGSTIYQVPVALSPAARRIKAIKWVVKCCRSRKGSPMANRLAQEILAAYKHEGAAYSKKIELHKVADANRAYSNLRARR